MVKSVNQQSIQAIYLEVNNQVKGFCSIFGGVSMDTAVLNNLEKHF